MASVKTSQLEIKHMGLSRDHFVSGPLGVLDSVLNHTMLLFLFCKMGITEVAPLPHVP